MSCVRFRAQLLVAVCVVLFVLCLPLRLALAFCCGVKLQPPNPGGPNIPDDDDPVIIDIQPPAPASATPAAGANATVRPRPRQQGMCVGLGWADAFLCCAWPSVKTECAGDRLQLQVLLHPYRLGHAIDRENSARQGLMYQSMGLLHRRSLRRDPRGQMEG